MFDHDLRGAQTRWLVPLSIIWLAIATLIGLLHPLGSTASDALGLVLLGVSAACIMACRLTDT